MTLGQAIHASFLQMVRQLDAHMARQLHGEERHRPFTTSPLQGPFTVQGQRLLLRRDKDYWLRVTSLETGLSTLLLAIEAQPPPTVRLRESEFAVVAVSSHAGDHAWARRSSYESLYALAYQAEAPAQPRVSLTFASPTAFRSQGRTLLLPSPRLVFSSLWECWQRFSPMPLETAWLASMTADVDVSRYTLRTRMLDFGSYRQVGFVGECEFMARPGVSDHVVRGRL